MRAIYKKRYEHNIGIFMKKLVNTVIFLGASFIGATVNAGTWHGSKISHVYPTASGEFILRFVSDSAACTSGESPDYYRVKVGKNDITEEGSKKIFATALAAAMAEKTVNIYFDETTSSCYINRIQIEI